MRARRSAARRLSHTCAAALSASRRRSADVAESVRKFIAENQTTVPDSAAALSGGAPKAAPSAPKRLAYGARALQAANPAGASRVWHVHHPTTLSHRRTPAGKALLETIERKQSNLCVAADVPTCAGVLALADAIGALPRGWLRALQALPRR